MKDRLLLFLVPRIASGFMRTLYATLRVRHLNPSNITTLNDAGKQYMFAFWHCHLLLLIFSKLKRPITVMISKHKDGELIARTIQRFGVDTSRGSSSRGGAAALKRMVDLAEEGFNIAITPDGPRGPARVAQPGVVLAAQRSGVPILPVALVAENKKQLRSWDRFEIPKPFSRVIHVYGEPITIPPDADEGELETLRKKVETVMRAICDETEANFEECWARAER